MKKSKAKQAPELRLTDLLRVVPATAALDKSDIKGGGSRQQFHPNAARSLEALAPKRFVYRKKRVKGPSALKKRILMERLRRHQYLFEQSNAAAESEADGSSKTVVAVYGLADGVDLDDPDEMQEIFSNAKTLLSPFGDIESLSLWRRKPDASSSSSSDESFVQAVFFEPNSARSAAGTLNGFILAGSPLRTALCSPDECQLMKSLEASDSANSMQPPPNTSVAAVAPSGLSSSEPTLATAVGSEPAEPRAVLMLLNVLQPEDLYGEEDELLEVLSDIFSLTSGLHHVAQGVLSLRIRRIRRPRRSRVLSSLRLCDPGLHPSPWAVLEVASATDAVRIARELQGKVIGGNPLQVSFLAQSSLGFPLLPLHQLETSPPSVEIKANPSNGDGSQSDENQALMKRLAVSAGLPVDCFLTMTTVSSDSSCSLQLSSLQDVAAVWDELVISLSREARMLSNAVDAAVQYPFQLVVSGYIGPEDWEELSTQVSARDELCTLKEDLLSLVHGLGLVSSVVVYPPLPRRNQPDLSNGSPQSKHTRNSNASTEKALEEEEAEEETDEEGEEGNEGDLEEKYEDGDHAPEITASKGWMSWSSKRELERGVCEADAENSKLGVTHEAGLVEVLFASVEACHRALIYMDGLVLGGSELRASALPAPATDVTEGILASLLPPSEPSQMQSSESLPAGEFACIHVEHIVDAADRESSANQPAMPPALDNANSRYVQAKQVNKLGMHSAPRIASIAVATEEINVVVKELLRLLSTFQQRLKEKNPLNYKRKLRFVTGLRQSLHGVRRGKVKLLILAPNTEASEELDQQISAVVEEAQRQDVPILYALNKRQLGKALQMSMKQSIVAIFDPDGAYELYRQILRFVVPR